MFIYLLILSILSLYSDFLKMSFYSRFVWISLHIEFVIMCLKTFLFLKWIVFSMKFPMFSFDWSLMVSFNSYWFPAVYILTRPSRWFLMLKFDNHCYNYSLFPENWWWDTWLDLGSGFFFCFFVFKFKIFNRFCSVLCIAYIVSCSPIFSGAKVD